MSRIWGSSRAILGSWGKRGETKLVTHRFSEDFGVPPSDFGGLRQKWRNQPARPNGLARESLKSMDFRVFCLGRGLLWQGCLSVCLSVCLSGGASIFRGFWGPPGRFWGFEAKVAKPTSGTKWPRARKFEIYGFSSILSG